MFERRLQPLLPPSNYAPDHRLIVFTSSDIGSFVVWLFIFLFEQMHEISPNFINHFFNTLRQIRAQKFLQNKRKLSGEVKLSFIIFNGFHSTEKIVTNIGVGLFDIMGAKHPRIILSTQSLAILYLETVYTKKSISSRRDDSLSEIQLK